MPSGVRSWLLRPPVTLFTGVALPLAPGANSATVGVTRMGALLVTKIRPQSVPAPGAPETPTIPPTTRTTPATRPSPPTTFLGETRFFDGGSPLRAGGCTAG